MDLAALVRDVVADMPGAGAVTLALTPGLPPLALDRTRTRLLLRNPLHYSAAAAH